MRKKMLLFFSMAFALLLISTNAFAEGSRDLVKNGGNRPYLEWQDTETLGIPRRNTMKVFARSGEKILLGSSINKGFDGHEIVVTDPSGEVTILEVEPDGTGFISNDKEMQGPYPENGGYTPIVYNVNQNGIYKIQFHSANVNNLPNPTALLANESYVGKQGNGIAAFDATVIGTDGNEITGRAYFDYICLNAGDNRLVTEGVFSDIYILTNDGYDYKISLNGINPFGFVLFANNRGFIDPVSNTSLYKTIGASNNTMSQDAIFGGIKILTPSGENTKTNITHKIFLNKPANDLPSSIPTEAQLPADVENVSFFGSEDNIATVSCGGTFTVTLSKDATYTVFLDTDNNGSFEDDVDVQLSNAGVAGKNTIFWNGKNGKGNSVQAGKVGVKVMAKGGEYHFPLLDVEIFTRGVRVELLNAPREVEGFDKFMIYYDDTDYITADGTPVSTRNKVYDEADTKLFTRYQNEKYLITPASAINGISSENGALAFSDPAANKDKTNFYGNQKGFDFWTYYGGNDASSEIEVKKGPETVVVTGNVFYDKDENTTYDLTENGLGNIPVTISSARGNVLAEVVADDNGRYSAAITPTGDGKYVVSVGNVPNGYIATTQSENITISERDMSIIYVPDIGFSYSVDVSVTIECSSDELYVGDDVTFTITASNNTSFVTNNTIVNAALPAFAEFISVENADDYNYDAETGEWNIGSIGKNDKVVMVVNAKVTKKGEYKYPVTISAEGDLFEADLFKNNSDEASYVVKQRFTALYENNFAYIFGRTDELMQPNECMYRGEVSAAIYRLKKQNTPDEHPDGFVYDIDAQPSFKDLVNHKNESRWDRSAVEYMVYMGMYQAKPNGYIHPANAVTRGEAFKAICIGLGFTENKDMSIEQYTDILVKAGYVEGDEKGNLNIDKAITRAEFCKIYNCIIGRAEAAIVTTDGEEVTPETYGFTDIDDAAWYYKIMLRATSAYTDEQIDISKRGVRNELDDYVVSGN